jgi:hypothetical protein
LHFAHVGHDCRPHLDLKNVMDLINYIFQIGSTHF